MDNNNLLMIILAFILGYMVNSMCGGRSVEGFLGGDGKTCDSAGGFFDSACEGEAASCSSEKVHKCCGKFMNACDLLGGADICVPNAGC